MGTSTPVTSLSALLALSAQHGKFDRLRVKDKEPPLLAGKESDKRHETLARRHIPEDVMTLPANYRTDPIQSAVVMLCLPFSGLISVVYWTFWKKKKGVSVCVCARAHLLGLQCIVKEEKQQTSKYLSTNYSQCYLVLSSYVCACMRPCVCVRACVCVCVCVSYTTVCFFLIE